MKDIDSECMSHTEQVVLLQSDPPARSEELHTARERRAGDRAEETQKPGVLDMNLRVADCADEIQIRVSH